MVALMTTTTSTTFERGPGGKKKKSFATCYGAAGWGDAIEIINSEDYGDGVAHTHAEV